VDVLRTCYNLAGVLADLAAALDKQNKDRDAMDKYREAFPYARRAEEGWTAIYGSGHPDSKDARALREEIEEEL